MNELIVKESIRVGFLDPLRVLWNQSHVKQGLRAYILANTRDQHTRCMLSQPGLYGRPPQTTSLDLPSRKFTLCFPTSMALAHTHFLHLVRLPLPPPEAGSQNPLAKIKQGKKEKTLSCFSGTEQVPAQGSSRLPRTEGSPASTSRPGAPQHLPPASSTSLS